MAQRTSKDESQATPRISRGWLGVIPVILLIVGVLFVGVFPTRLYLDQRQELDEKRENLAQLDADVAALEAARDNLNDPAALERKAREEHLLVPSGADLFVIQEPTPTAVDFPEEWPWSGFEHLVNGS